ncbi:MAG TPA: hypothetical protein VKI62_07850 [Bacteroidota bacterium]|nr:hypothetical protein [Bacteroidota bacterium]
MPLNVNDQEREEVVRTEKPKAQPISHLPVRRSVTLKNVLITVFILIVLASIVFLVYLFSSMNPRNQVAQQSTQVPLSKPPANINPNGSQNVVVSPPPVPTGQYTIYIASYLDREPAAEEVGRWNEAGYHSFVVQAVGHFRVALGIYEKVSAARHDAESLFEAFENGYWIGHPQ